jgi:phosphoglycerate dehydrogenase-like enzyme
MDLPRIAALYDGVPPDVGKFPKNLQQFFRVFNPKWLRNDELQNIGDYDALVMHPRWKGKVDDECFNIDGFKGDFNKKFQVATISISRSLIKLPKAEAEGRVEIIRAKYGNLDSTAELAIWMAITLRRKLHLHCMNLVHGIWQNENLSQGSGLKGTSWAIIGIGKLGSRVLARLPGLGICKVKAFYDKPDKIEEKIKILIEDANISWKEPEILKISEGLYETTIEGNSIASKQRLRIEVSADLDYVISDVDVVCLTLLYKPKGEERSTEGLITKKHIEKLQENSVFINVARAEILAKDVYESFFEKNLGFGSDILAEECEGKLHVKDEKYQTHKIWAAFNSSMLNTASDCKVSNVLLTPHLGGHTSESDEAMSEEVIEKLLENLGILEKYYSILPLTSKKNISIF